MNAILIFEHLAVIGTYKKAVIVTAITAVVMSFLTGCQEQFIAAPNEPNAAYAPASTEIDVLSQKLRQLVKELEYPDAVAEDFAGMLISWKDVQEHPVLVVWKNKLTRAKEDYEAAKISKEQFAMTEWAVIRELSQRIKEEISTGPDKSFDLADVVRHKQADCTGYSQTIYVLANSVGLSVQTIEVAELVIPVQMPKGTGRIACIAALTNDKKVMVDLAAASPMVSAMFDLKAGFDKVGGYWKLRDEDNPLRIHKKIQILDKNGLIAAIYCNRGNKYNKSGQPAEAVSILTKAIELAPKFAWSYNNRGRAYLKLNRPRQAILDFNSVVGLYPDSPSAYNYRGVAYFNSQQFDRALADFNEAVRFDPNYAEPYFNRGSAYLKLNRPYQAVADYTEAVKLKPKWPRAYFRRGFAYAGLRRYNEAIQDYSETIKLNPAYPVAYYRRAVAYSKMNQPNETLADLTQAIALNPDYADAYVARGATYAFLKRTYEAEQDLYIAVELNPALKQYVQKISDQFELGLQLEDSSGPDVK